MNCKIKKKKRPQRKKLTAEEAIAKQTAMFDAAHGKGPDRALGGEAFDVSEFAEDGEEDGRLSCEFCGRHFNPERIAHHEEICYNVHGPGKRDRQQFMSAEEMRLKDTEFANWKNSRRDVSALKPKSRWRERHHALQNTALQGKLIDMFKAAGIALAELPRPITHWYEDGRPCTPEPNPRMSAARLVLSLSAEDCFSRLDAPAFSQPLAWIFIPAHCFDDLPFHDRPRASSPTRCTGARSRAKRVTCARRARP